MARESKDPADTQDAGMTLDELSQAFSTLLNRHAPPRSQVAASPGDDRQELPDSPTSIKSDLTAEMSTRSIVEAALFVGRPDNMPIEAAQLAVHLRSIDSAEIDTTIAELNAQYEANGCPYEIASEGSGYRMVLRSGMNSVRGRFHGRVRSARLSPAAIEVLSLVAYHEPLSADEVAQMRGAPSGHLLRSLVRRQLLRLQRGEGKGAKSKYFTTARFLKLFHLRSLEDLPRSEDLQRQ